MIIYTSPEIPKWHPEENCRTDLKESLTRIRKTPANATCLLPGLSYVCSSAWPVGSAPGTLSLGFKINSEVSDVYLYTNRNSAEFYISDSFQISCCVFYWLFRDLAIVPHLAQRRQKLTADLCLGTKREILATVSLGIRGHITELNATKHIHWVQAHLHCVHAFSSLSVPLFWSVPPRPQSPCLSIFSLLTHSDLSLSTTSHNTDAFLCLQSHPCCQVALSCEAPYCLSTSPAELWALWWKLSLVLLTCYFNKHK